VIDADGSKGCIAWVWSLMNRRRAFAAAVLVLLAGRVASADGPLVTMTPTGGVLHVPDGPAIPLSLIGTGLRKKRVVLVTVRVYTARFLVSADVAAKFDRTPAGALDSLDEISAVAMHLTFERSVSAQQLSDSLRSAMNANGYRTDENRDLQALSRAIRSTGGIPSGSIGILAAFRADPVTDLVLYQAPSGTIAAIKGGSGLKRALMSAWFGQPADGGLRALRDEILGAPAAR
jgi:hypothetical protein